MDKHIIAGFAGIGKTTLSRKNKDIIDMEIREHKYANWKSDYDLHDWYKKKHIINNNYLEKYLEAVKEEIENGNHKIIFVWLQDDVLEWLEKQNINYILEEIK